MLIRRLLASVALPAALWTLASPARADEGMWLVNNPPAARLKADYQFEATPAWLEHMQKSAVRFNTGGSGSLVSADGLVLTNHHVISDMLSKLSTKDRDLLKTGFLARTRSEEIACPDLELNVLWTIEDVTERVTRAGAGAASEGEANLARRKEMSAIESESREKTGNKSEIVTLYQGARYHLYTYKRYTDVRFVFAPEQDAAFFGGDTDNFEFPRYNLDCSLLRIYENGQPIKPEHYLKWSVAGTNENDLVFVFGHPGRTRRGYTVDHFKYLRDFETPRRLARLYRAEINAQTFAGRSKEHARIAADDVAGIANGRKASVGLMGGLADPAVLGAKMKAEDELRSKAQSAGGADAASLEAAHANLAKALANYRTFAARHQLLSDGPGRAGELLSRAVHFVRLADELPKPSKDRLREYGDSRIESLEQELFSPAPIYDLLETHRLEQYFLSLVEQLGGDDPTVQKVLAGKSPRARAQELVSACTFKSVEARQALVKGGASAVNASSDPLIALVKLIDAEARSLRMRYENEMEAVERSSYSTIAAARFRTLGESVYPDATFTLRLSYGSVKGFPGEGAMLAPFTKMGGMFTRFEERKGEAGFEMPESWLKAKGAIKLDTPFNFVCTADIIGGNSGSPVVNRAGELVGLIFDGNIHSLVGDVQYDATLNRAVAVDSRAIIEALRSIYGAQDLVSELSVTK